MHVLAGEAASLSGLAKAVDFTLGAARAVQQLSASHLASPDSLMRSIASSEASSSEASPIQQQSDFISAAETATLDAAEWASETVRVGSKWSPSGMPIFTQEREGVVAEKVLMLEMASASSPESVQIRRFSKSPGSAGSKGSSICSSAPVSEFPADSALPQARKRLHYSASAKSEGMSSARHVEQSLAHSEASSPAGRTELPLPEAPQSAEQVPNVSLPDATALLTISGVQLKLYPLQEPSKGFEVENNGLLSTDTVLTSGKAFDFPITAQLETPGRVGVPETFRTPEHALGNCKLLQGPASGLLPVKQVTIDRGVPGTPEVPEEPVKLSRAPALLARAALSEEKKAEGEAGSVAKALDFEGMRDLGEEGAVEDEGTGVLSVHSASDREEPQTPRFGPIHRRESQVGTPWETGLESAGFVLVEKAACTASPRPAGGTAAKPSASAVGLFEDGGGESGNERVAPGQAAEKRLSPEEVLAEAKRALRLNRLKPLTNWNCQGKHPWLSCDAHSLDSWGRASLYCFSFLLLTFFFFSLLEDC